jgi:hypothetical protein
MHLFPISFIKKKFFQPWNIPILYKLLWSATTMIGNNHDWHTMPAHRRSKLVTLKFWGSLPGGSETVLASVGVRWLLELPLDKKRKNVIRTRGNYSNKVQELYIISVKLGDTWCSMEKCWKRMKSWGSSWCNLKRI